MEPEAESPSVMKSVDSSRRLCLRVVADAAVAEFLVVDLRLLGAFAGEFLDALEFLALALGGEDALLDRLGDLRVLVQVVVEIGLEEIADEGAQRLAIRRDAWRSRAWSWSAIRRPAR